MKQPKNLSKFFVFTLLLLSFTAFGQEKIITEKEIPQAIKTYIGKHFPEQKIIKAEIDREGLSKKYEIKLSNKTELDFNSKSEIIKIDGKTALPASVIPPKIAAYVKANYPDNVIIEWKLKGKNQKVGLDNDLDLEFTLKGEFIRIDI